MRVLLYFCLLSLLSGPLYAAEKLHVAVASNFASAMQKLVSQFELQSGYRVSSSYASSGKLFAQITHGAPYDIFLSADTLRPRRLESLGWVVPDQRFTYAIGRLVLWAPDARSPDEALQQLRQGGFSYLSMANPKIAPYGAAAMEVLEQFGLSRRFLKRTVRGENIAQAYQFIYSGNAQLGFVAKAQVVDASKPLRGAIWHVPGDFYTPIEQQAVWLKRAEHHPVAIAFVDYLRSDVAKQIIMDSGYDGLTTPLSSQEPLNRHD
ncbi:MAG: molybdate ABC transporter substrate-binding protein [Gammaproteobacteria bacterium]|nr:molybdate ABC transporter substrate-binding protein [Gammaproteobacteria bacterium]MCF6230005.1 molybdate ABC transporter substrate-binding protein [Gammaproteobacteria bacterium]